MEKSKKYVSWLDKEVNDNPKLPTHIAEETVQEVEEFILFEPVVEDIDVLSDEVVTDAQLMFAIFADKNLVDFTLTDVQLWYWLVHLYNFYKDQDDEPAGTAS